MSGTDLNGAQYAKLTRLIYASAFDQTNWQTVLDEVHKATGGVCAHLFGYDIPGNLSLGLTASGYAPEFIDSYNAYYGALNSWAPGFSDGDVGVVLPSQWMCPKEDLFRTEFYNDWVLPQENVAAGGGAMLFKDTSRMLAFGGNIRLKDEEKLEGSWLRTVGLLLPHLQQAFEISRVVSGQALELDLLHRRTMSDGGALMLLGGNGLLLFGNERSASMITEGGVLRDDHAGRVTFCDPQADAMLSVCLRQLRDSGVAPISATFECVEAAPMARRYTCRAVRYVPEDHPASSFALLLGYLQSALLVTVSPAYSEAAAPDSFRLRHDLTESEMAIASGIADGLTLTELADLRSVSIHTVRNQLKAAMQKTGARRQAELVRLMANRRSGD
ncbi:LuxR C-terminal-related transcriptional regulator [Oricola sp.]|uniref:helix-turn-helix transcriptional regulator n=1 Tax=Oricola sp. TaxID=1979950 RepID=UPI0025F69695|nr:LuxR C-terminal-related transcriptional regulator [Oricola sp.]MCI5075337.1 LuxR C-terminal-related transcriptional regulator [Oricola sp.]